jgi:SAM-dependent methyltransferase
VLPQGFFSKETLMALMFSRLANNHVKAGYFPTDEDTLSRIQSALATPSHSARRLIRICDPCCGTGAALADIAQYLVDYQQGLDAPSLIETLGVEFDKERAWEAKKLLFRVIHADIHDVVIKPRSLSLLFLNPPYGFGVSDSANMDRNIGDGGEKAERLERTFLKKTATTLMPGGVLVYVVPFYALDDEIRTYLARHFRDLRFYMAPEKQFQQCVIFGVKVKPTHPRKDVLEMLTKAQAGELKDQVLPTEWCETPYILPVATDDEFDFRAVRIDRDQLVEELKHFEPSLLWNGFDRHFNQARASHRRPLRDLSRWHLALALAAGQVRGMIKSKGGRSFLIKGDTFKRKQRTVTTEINDKGESQQTVTMLDKFVPVISAIEFTPGPNKGRIVKII